MSEAVAAPKDSAGPALRCYWCGHTPVVLGAKCPGCNTQLEIITDEPRTPLGAIATLARKGLVLAEDQRVLQQLDALCGEGSSAETSQGLRGG